MTQIPLLSGFYANETADFVRSYPINYEPIAGETGLSNGYLKSPSGVEVFATGPGIDRGGIDWDSKCYRVMGNQLVKVKADGTVLVLGNVGTNGKPVSLDYSFDRLSIASNQNLFYYNDALGLVQVTDIDLGIVLDQIFVDGYFMTTDGESLVVTELSDPMSVDPLKYGSSETDPDPVLGLELVRGEVYACNRNTIDVFNNVGGNGFPFALNTGAVIPKGIVGTHAKTLFAGNFAFVGSGRGEALGVYQAGAGQAIKLSTREIDMMLAAEAEPENIICEAVVMDDEQRLYIHLSDRTLVFSAAVTLKLDGKPVWHVRRGGAAMDADFRPRFFTNCYGQWLCGDKSASNVGVLNADISTDFGDIVGRRFDTVFIYNEGKGGLIHSLELAGLPGRSGGMPVVFMSYTKDGETWSEERAVSTGSLGQRRRRVQGRPHWRFSNYLGLRFRTADEARTGWARLEAKIEPLGV